MAKHSDPPPSARPSPRFGLGKGKIYPHEHAAQLLNPVRRLIVSPARLARRLRLAPTDRVLEIGCGPGYFSADVARLLPHGTLVTLDIQLEMLRMAGARVREHGQSCQRVQGSAMALPFRDTSFDVVFLVSVLGETGDCEACLREIRRVLVPRGRVSITEIRNDADFIARAQLQVMTERAGFAREAGFGWRWNYTDNFTAAAGRSTGRV